MIRNNAEYKHTRERLSELRREFEVLHASEGDEITSAAVDALGLQIEDLRSELDEYEDLKEGRLLAFETDGMDSVGELVTRARIARGLSQAELAEELGMSQQQVARYERDGYQKISLWRLAEIAEALELDLTVRARLAARSTSYPVGTG